MRAVYTAGLMGIVAIVASWLTLVVSGNNESRRVRAGELRAAEAELREVQRSIRESLDRLRARDEADLERIVLMADRLGRIEAMLSESGLESYDVERSVMHLCQSANSNAVLRQMFIDHQEEIRRQGVPFHNFPGRDRTELLEWFEGLSREDQLAWLTMMSTYLMDTFKDYIK